MNKTFKHIIATIAVLFSAMSSFAQWNTDRITAIGRNALYFEDYVLSIQYFNQVIKIKPHIAEPYIYRAIAKVQLSDFDGALYDCNQAIALNPFMPGAYYVRAFVFSELNKPDQAEKDLSQALIFAPENKTYLLLRADTKAHLEQYDEALADIQQLINREPTSAHYYLEKTIIQLQKQDTLDALQSINEAIHYDRANTNNWSTRALINLMLDRIDSAMYDYNTAIRLGSKWEGDYINRAAICYKNNNFNQALKDLEKAISLNPKNYQTYFNRAVLRYELGDNNNALDDINRAYEIDSSHAEILYQRGLINLQLKQWQSAINDYESLIDKYPYFLPSYYLAAQAYKKIGKNKKAEKLVYQAQTLENNKEQIQKQQNQLNTNMQIAENQPVRNRKKEFSNNAAQNMPEQNDNKYASNTRGRVQKNYADLVSEPNIVLTFYSQQNTLRQTNYSHVLVEQINREKLFNAPLKLTYQELPLDTMIIQQHFSNIDHYTQLINQSTQDKNTAALLFARAIELALVQDYSTAIEDLNQALKLNDKLTLAYFCRANWRYKLLQYTNTTDDHQLLSQGNKNTMSKEQMIATNLELILMDYDQVIKQQQDFSFAYYNKANILATQKNYKGAIEYYNLAIQKDHDFAEAYFNRGLVRIYIDDNQNGLNDLSKAGELGIYQAYNLITRLR